MGREKVSVPLAGLNEQVRNRKLGIGQRKVSVHYIPTPETGGSFEADRFSEPDSARIFRVLQQVPHFALHAFPCAIGGANFEIVFVPHLICPRNDEARGVDSSVC